MMSTTVLSDPPGPTLGLYVNGREVDKEPLRWPVPADCLLDADVSRETLARIRLPESASTFSVLSTAGDKVRIWVDRDHSTVDILADRPAKVLFVAFEGTYLDWRPIPTHSYEGLSESL